MRRKCCITLRYFAKCQTNKDEVNSFSCTVAVFLSLKNGNRLFNSTDFGAVVVAFSQVVYL